ncbi:MAG: arsenic efflux protein [Clostridia bacterium]|nr:arsenic efflux protein [Clostridia bacterium]
MWEVLWHSASHALQDSAKLLPFLFLTYLLMEILEKKAGEKAEDAVRRAGRFGPLWGGVLGAVPQCGFSAAASSLYAARVLTVGTLLAVFLSTSDEMVPIMLAATAGGQTDLGVMFQILGAKVLIGLVSGFAVDAVVSGVFRRRHAMDIHHLCEQEHCDCESGVWKSALLHTVKIFAYLVLFTFAINLAIELIGENTVAGWLNDLPVVGVLVAALIGMIPNCAASVLVTRLYIDGILSTGGMLAGLLTGAGVGLLVLFRLNRRPKENLLITLGLYALGAGWGLLFDLLGVVF